MTSMTWTSSTRRWPPSTPEYRDTATTMENLVDELDRRAAAERGLENAATRTFWRGTRLASTRHEPDEPAR